MRMWNIPPYLLCDKHLLGEHAEMHMFVGTIKKGISIKGYLEGGLVEVHHINSRHTQLALELKARGFSHRSPISPVEVDMLDRQGIQGSVDQSANLEELINRCSRCRERINSHQESELFYS